MLRKRAFAAGLFGAMGLEEVGVDGIGDACDGVPLEQGAFPGEIFEPVATGYEGDGMALVEFFLFEEDAV